MNRISLLIQLAAISVISQTVLADDVWSPSTVTTQFTAQQGNVDGLAFGEAPPIRTPGGLSGTPLSLDLSEISGSQSLLDAILAGPTDLLTQQGVDAQDMRSGAETYLDSLSISNALDFLNRSDVAMRNDLNVQNAWRNVANNLNHLQVTVKFQSYFKPHNWFGAVLEENDHVVQRWECQVGVKFKVDMTVVDVKRTDGSDASSLQKLVGSKFTWTKRGPHDLLILDRERSEVRKIFNDNAKVEEFRKECLAR